MPYLLRVPWILCLAVRGGGWLFQSATENTSNSARDPPEGATAWSQVRGWAGEHAPNLTRISQGWAEWTSSWTEPATPTRKGYSWDGGLSLFFDTVVSVVGWTLFGNAWPGVRTGCQRAFRILVLLLFCLAAHYLWALCWPVISFCTAIVFGCAWLIRAVVRKLGTLIYWAQKATGGVPEAAGATFLGPGTGKIPETADLRTFKKVGSCDKWILVRREGGVPFSRLVPIVKPSRPLVCLCLLK